MRFLHDGVLYALDFQRDHKLVCVGSVPVVSTDADGNTSTSEEPILAPSRYPYTTARLLLVDPEKPFRDWSEYRAATVGCWHQEVLHRRRGLREQGRLHALRSLGHTLDRVMRQAMWQAYAQRVNGRV